MGIKRLSFFKSPVLLTGVMGLLTIVPLLTGCATQNAQKRIAAFSTALTIATTNTSEAFAVVDQKYYQTKVALLINKYDPAVGFKPDVNMHFLTGEDLAVREKLFESLQLYAQKLADIMSDEQLKEFDEETKAFGTSLQNLNKNPAFVKIAGHASGTDINTFTKAVNVIGRFFINYKREKGVKEIVLEMKKPIEDICDTLIVDIGQPVNKEGKEGMGLRDQSWRQYDQMLTAQEDFIRANWENINKLDPRLKAEMIAKLPTLVAEQQKAETTLKTTKETLEKLKKTHSELVMAFNETCPTLENLISELISEGKRVREYYKSLAND